MTIEIEVPDPDGSTKASLRAERNAAERRAESLAAELAAVRADRALAIAAAQQPDAETERQRDAALAQVVTLRATLERVRDVLRAEIQMPHVCSDCGWNVGGVPKGLHNLGCRVANAVDEARDTLADTAQAAAAHDEAVRHEGQRVGREDARRAVIDIITDGVQFLAGEKTWQPVFAALVDHDARVAREARAAALEEAARAIERAFEADQDVAAIDIVRALATTEPAKAAPTSGVCATCGGMGDVPSGIAADLSATFVPCPACRGGR